MKRNKYKLFLVAIVFMLPSVAMASTLSEQLEQLLEAPRASMKRADIENRFDFVVDEKNTEIRINVYIKLRESSFTTKSGPGQASKKTVIEKGLARLPKSIRGDVLKTYERRGMISASLNLAQLRHLKQQEYVTWIEPWPKFEALSEESHGYTGITTVHNGGNTGAGQTIAIIDSEYGAWLSLNNPRVIGGKDIADDDSNFLISPNCNAPSHGTQVAGVVTGVAPDANLVLVKIASDARCNDTPTVFDDFDIIDALDWVLANKETFDISVVNLSLGAYLDIDTVASCSYFSQAYTDSIEDLYNAGITVVAGAGNLKSFAAFPACLPTTISVGAVYDADSTNPAEWPGRYSLCAVEECLVREIIDEEGFSLGYYFGGDHPYAGEMYQSALSGPQCPGRDRVTCYSSSRSADFVDVLAPADCARVQMANGSVNECFRGTSAAAPFVAGLVALLKAEAGGNCLTFEDIRGTLRSSPNLITDGFSGITTPRVNASVIADFVTPGQCDPETSTNTLSVPTLVAVLSVLL